MDGMLDQIVSRINREFIFDGSDLIFIQLEVIVPVEGKQSYKLVTSKKDKPLILDPKSFVVKTSTSGGQ